MAYCSNEPTDYYPDTVPSNLSTPQMAYCPNVPTDYNSDAVSPNLSTPQMAHCPNESTYYNIYFVVIQIFLTFEMQKDCRY